MGNDADDPEKAFYWYEKAAQQGHSFAQFNVGSDYLFGKGVKANLDNAIDWLTKSAMQGNTSAQTRLGNIYESDDIKDGSQAVSWYKKAAEGKEALGCYYLARAYLNGVGVKRDYIQSYAWSSVAVKYVPVAADIQKKAEKELSPSQRQKAAKIAEEYSQLYSQ